MIYIYEPRNQEEYTTFRVRAENRADAINRIKELLDVEKEACIGEISESKEYTYENSRLREATAEESLEYLGLDNIKQETEEQYYNGNNKINFGELARDLLLYSF